MRQCCIELLFASCLLKQVIVLVDNKWDFPIPNANAHLLVDNKWDLAIPSGTRHCAW